MYSPWGGDNRGALRCVSTATTPGERSAASVASEEIRPLGTVAVTRNACRSGSTAWSAANFA